MEAIKYALYLRKSTDSEDQQVQSLGDQRSELMKVVQRKGLNIVVEYEESMSAKRPGRPKFAEMMTMIEKGKVDGIVCWKINRLSRNPIDGGRIQYDLQQKIIKSIITPSSAHCSDENTLVLGVELGVATQFSRDLSKDVTRGLASKAEKGWRPGIAPLGYKNDKFSEKGKKKILVDEKTFPIVRKLWDLMLTGKYSVADIGRIGNNELGLRTKYRKIKEVSDSHIYRIFTNTFYYGEYEYMNTFFMGKHTPMITIHEYDQVQRILGQKGRPRPQTKVLPYRGIIKCGECGCTIVADEKIKKNKTNNKIRTYVYLRCMHHKPKVACVQRAISEKELEKQILVEFDKFILPEKVLSFAVQALRKYDNLDSESRIVALRNQNDALKQVQKSLDNLLNVYISQENEDREILTPEEFKTRKSSIVNEKSRIQAEITRLERDSDEWIELTEKTFRFATYAKHWFLEGDGQTKTTILKALGSNHILMNQIISLNKARYLRPIAKKLSNPDFQNLITVELDESSLDKTKTAFSEAVSVLVSK